MSWINRLFQKKEGDPPDEEQKPDSTGDKKLINAFEGLEGLRFGRYSDNNKSYQKTRRWYDAEDLFKDKKYQESLFAFFEYLRDDEEDNVTFTQEGETFRFTILQGSKKIHGYSDGKTITACAPLALMPTPITAVMRRLLDMNYSLYYSRTAMDEKNTLCMIFDTEVTSADPNKMYYGLKELATKADRQDDMLLVDFPSLQPAGTEHVEYLPQHELEVKYKYFRKWIQDTLDEVAKLNQDSFSGAIAYLLLTLIYRIDFLITPEAKLLAAMDKINSIYWEKKDDVALVERNKLMKDEIVKLLDISQEEFSQSVYRSKGTFSINQPPKQDKIEDNITNANKDSHWYKDNKYHLIAITLVEYGLLYSEYIYSMPRVVTDLVTVFMAVIHADYFSELGIKESLYDIKQDTPFYETAILDASRAAINKYQDKYKNLGWSNPRISFESIYDFAISYTESIAKLNLETKR